MKIIKKKRGEYKKKTETQQKLIHADKYDVMGIGTQVHTTNVKDIVNEDFVLSDLSAPEREIVLRTLVLVRHIKAFLDMSKFQKERIIKVSGEDFKEWVITEEDLSKVKEIAEDIYSRKISDIQASAVLSRGKKARVIEAITVMIKGAEKDHDEAQSKADVLKPSKKEGDDIGG